ncbi:MAG: hypothetical protein Ct9H300mP14_05680 [Gammaproteobacteria bacterium]|nr:MAG: hypothetical protein Ct9H300mP14_05680 [Gammaproteobacteria bacterium]
MNCGGSSQKTFLGFFSRCRRCCSGAGHGQAAGCRMAIIDKRRPKANEAKVMHIIGSVDNHTCVLMDDMVDTANTLCEAASALKGCGRDTGEGLLYPPGALRFGGRKDY